MLVMGPWAHGGWAQGDGEQLGHVTSTQKTAEFYRDTSSCRSSKHYLKGDARREAARGLRLRDRHQPVAAVRRLAAAGSDGKDALFSSAGGS